MKQILQSLKTGVTQVSDIPIPNINRRQLLIGTSRTLVSAGTERMLLEFGKAGWIEKARQQPDKVRMVLEKIKTDGLQPTIEAVFDKLDQPLPLGYCNMGRVLDVGADVGGFLKGDRVISNGKHAEVVSVPRNLCAKVPETVSDDEAAFTVLGSIALQGIRLAQPTLGETVVVTGLGLVGLMTVQLLRAHGCRVLGMDFDKDRLDLAAQFGAEIVNLAEGQDPVAAAQTYSRDRGVDAVILTVSSKSDEPISQAAKMCRKRGRIVLVGVTGLSLSRADFFEKELTFQVSCSYGPGRYDPNYEEKGSDYPVGFVRWTEQRNFEAVLDMMADGKLDVKPLISHRLEIEEAEKAYELVGGEEKSLGILLTYPGIEITEESRTVNFSPSGSHGQSAPSEGRSTEVSLSFIGAGNYASKILMPAFKDAGVKLKSVATNTGVGGVHAGRKHGFIETTTDASRLFSDAETDAIVIATRHDSHAGFVLEALRSGKHVFVEKPLCLTLEELEEIGKVCSEIQTEESSCALMVGFNRRFSPQVLKIKQLLNGVSGPKAFVMTVNAGKIPPDHWTHDPETGGGRIVGEACHFIDLLRFLSGSSIKTWGKIEMESSTGDTVTLQIGFEDGSVGTIHYFANGSKAFPKERLEVFASGGILQLDNFRKLHGFGWPGFRKMNLWRQDKGQKACARAFVDAIKEGNPSPVSLDEILEVSKVAIDLQGEACS
jgi:predicted dehydrogenase/threonine dehydrogenase-like Zn-dependent dehydrogenase